MQENQKENILMKKSPAFPSLLSQPEELDQIQGKINAELVAHTKASIKKRKLKIKDFLDWACRAYLLQHDPKTAAKLGIKPGND